MKNCCKFWKEQKRIYTEQICLSTPKEALSPFVENMRMIIGCPNCLTLFKRGQYEQ